jgi:predicted SnoaL-like aldol condensation-catalyzing enzyme
VASPEQNKKLVREVFDTLSNRRDYTRAEAYWPPDYIQHSAHNRQEFVNSGRQ